MSRSFSLAALLLSLALATALSGCGGGDRAVPPSSAPFDLPPPPAPPADDTPPTTPAPTPPREPVFQPDAYVHARHVPYGAFPSDLMLWGDTAFTTDGDQLTPEGLNVVPLAVAGSSVAESTDYAVTTISDVDLVDSDGIGADVDLPIGFGFFANEMVIVEPRLGCILVNAGGSDLSPTLSNLVVFDPTYGVVRQTVDLTGHVPSVPGAADSLGRPVPPEGYRQSGAEGLAFVPTEPGRGRLYVAMSNLIFSEPSYGQAKFPGTVQVYDVDLAADAPVSPVSDPIFTTRTIDVGGYNPGALCVIGTDGGTHRVLVTVCGTTAYDASFRLVPQTDSSVVALDGASGGYLGRFSLGPAGLSATRPALGRDAAGHRVGFFPSSVTGEVYLLRLDGLYSTSVDVDRLAILRGPANGIPVTAARSGGPGGNVTGVGLAPDGRTLVVAGFGDLYAAPNAIPGQLFLLNLPADLVSGAEFGTNFVPGSTLYGTVPGRTLGSLVVMASSGVRPDVLVAVSSPFDLATYLATGPATLGTLHTFGLIQ